MKYSLKMRRISALLIAAAIASCAGADPVISGSTVEEGDMGCIPAAPGVGIAPPGGYVPFWGECMPFIWCGAVTIDASASALPAPGVMLLTTSSYSSYGLGPCDTLTGTGSLSITAADTLALANSPAGHGWMQLSRPVIEMTFVDDTDPEDTEEDVGNTGDRIILYLSPTKVLQFYRSADPTVFYGVNGAMGAFKYHAKDSNNASVWEYDDQSGNKFYFFGFTVASGFSKVCGQLWKVENASGGTGSAVMYLGHPTTINTAITSGFYYDSSVLTSLPGKVIDTAGREIEYTYVSVDSALRYATAKTYMGSGGGKHLVHELAYTYYDGTTDADDGSAGDLKTISEKIYLSDNSIQTKTQYMRYYVGSWDEASPGHEHQLKLMMDSEGCRRWLIDNPGDDFDDLGGETDSTLKPYSSHFAMYYDEDGDTDGDSGAGTNIEFRAYKVWKYTSNTDCCSGTAPTDTVELDYLDNTFDGYVITNSYDASGDWDDDQWRSRTIVINPDNSRRVIYFDEYNQKLAEIIANSDYTKCWATRYERDSIGRVVKIQTPECVSYVHSTRAFTVDADDGLVNHTQYDTVAPGLSVTKTLHSKGNSGTQYLDSEIAYLATGSNYYLNLGTGPDVKIHKPMPVSMKQFKTEITSGGTAGTDYDETTIAYTFYSAFLGKSIVRTLPIVDDDKNGANSADAAISTYLRQDGRLIFSGTADNRYTFFEYDSTTGQITRRVTDVNSSDTNASTANSTTYSFGLTLSGSGKNIVTTHTYDEQGRGATTTLPTGRVMANWYTKLNDNRSVILSVPRKVSTTYYGPVGYSVTNLAGKKEASGIITLVGSNNEAGSISSWIDYGSDKDPIEAVSSTYGAVARLNVTEYTSNGVKPTKSRAIYTLDTDVAGSDSDDSYVYYDSMGRVIRRVDATGTISRTVFDAIGRPYSQWIGTDDTGWPSSGNMTETSRQYFDGATSTTLEVGNHRLTLRVVDENGDWTGTGDQRNTTNIYDYRGRSIVQSNPVSPHGVSKYDNRGRRIASGTFSSTSGMTAATDPTSTTTNRLSLSETFFNERGQVWKSLQHMVLQTGGSAGTYSGGDDMITLNWYDKNGRNIKSTGPDGLRKIAYDRLDRAERRYSLAKIVDSTYDDADDVDGDTVLEEQLTNFDDASGVALASINLARTVEASTYTGDLRDTTTTPGVIADTDLVVSSTIHARAQITAMYYDTLDRHVNTVQLGTEAIDGVGSATFTRSSYSLPSTSDTELVTTTTYNKDGTVLEVAQAKDDVTRFLYDQAGRTIATISNYVNGTPGTDDDNYVRTVYANGQMWKLWVDLDGDNAVDSDDQVTEYLYGTEKGTLGSQISSTNEYYSQIATGHLLTTVIYPTQDGGSTTTNRSVHTAYNALSEAAWTKDQNGTVIATDFDLGGRILERTVPSLGTDVDGWVQRIVLDYTNRGQTLTVDQYAATSGGSPINGVKYTYDDWGNIAQLDQDFDSAVAGGANFKSIEWGYSRVAPTNGRLSYRRVSETLPDGSDVTFDYGTSGGLDDLAGRVQSVSLDVTGSPVEIANYQYMGTAQVVKRELPEPNLTSLSGPSQLDRFNRITQDAWSNGSSNVQQFDITYDRNSNIRLVKDPILDNYNGSAFVNSFSTKFDMDGRDRVVRADRGVESGGNIGGTQYLNQLWTLSQTGNWTNFKNDFDGDNNGTDTDEVNEDRTFNNSNEILTRTDPSATLVHDRSGEMTDDGKNFKYIYDAFGRLKKVTDRAGSPVTKAEYKYNGLNQRIGWHYDSKVTGVVDDDDPWFFIVYDARWRIVNTYRVEKISSTWTIDADAKERFVHHAAGIDGRGGSSYIDSMILSDREITNDWWDTAASTMAGRFYYLQNRRADTCAMTDDSGLVLRNFRYSAYGSRTEVDGGDYNRDGSSDIFDYLDVLDDKGNNVMRADINRDGSLTNADVTAISDLIDSDDDLLGGSTRNLYAGYENDPSLEEPAVSSGGDSALVAWESMYHVRYRVYSTELGRWTRRDPLGYVDGMNLYEYCRSDAVALLDPLGLSSLRQVISPTPTPVDPAMPRIPIVPAPVPDKPIYPDIDDPEFIPDRIFPTQPTAPGKQAIRLCCVDIIGGFGAHCYIAKWDGANIDPNGICSGHPFRLPGITGTPGPVEGIPNIITNPTCNIKSGFGPIRTFCGPWQDAPDGGFGTKHLCITIIETDVDKSWDCMTKLSQIIADCKIDYDPLFGDNSNSVAYTLALYCGGNSPAQPPSPGMITPGWGRDLCGPGTCCGNKLRGIP